MPSSSKGPRSYAAVLEDRAKVDAELRRARLTDPDEHFDSYDPDKVRAAYHAGPEPGTNDHPLQWYTSEPIIDAQAAAIEAERRYLEEDTPEAKQAFQEAMSVLSDVRAEHRRGRPIAPVAVAGSVPEIEQRRSAMRTLRSSGFDDVAIASITNRPLAEVQSALSGRED